SVVTGRVTLADHIFEQQGFKVVTTSDGQVREIPPGERPEPNEEILGRFGEPAFRVRLEQELRNDGDVADEIGLALRRVGERLFHVMPDGREVPGEDGPVEWMGGPAVHGGALVMFLDTDDKGFSRAMIDTMAGIFVEELTPLAVQADISAAPASTGDLGPPWMSSDERRQS
ncbi:MAG TPA: hypothetical protein VFI44_04060, partial [Ornithinibacter sp.]|nr:hypothetical protein [Ornithinibacter sp.]